jgi:hydroxymethylglutaryl-CoA reductase (NADPH)
MVSADKAVSLRRWYCEDVLKMDLKDIPEKDYNYELIKGACCENPIGYIPVPIGVAGPILINGEKVYVPLATTEGALIASINRGCKVVSENGGINCQVRDIGMTRAVLFAFKDPSEANRFSDWIREPSTFNSIKCCFNETSSFAKLRQIEPTIIGLKVHLRFVSLTGDAMGMNMVSKGCEKAVKFIKKKFPSAEFRSLSSNLCTDKKAAAINWDKGRGKNATATVTIKAEVVEKQLHTTVDNMVRLCYEKCFEGSALAGTIGGNNCQSANIVAAMFIATGQDPAQVVSSSMCMTTMNKSETGDLIVSCTMKCLEVGTVGGGTILAPQKTALKMLNCCGPNQTNPGENSCRLAKIICSTVLAGEVSLMAALCTDDLVKSHMRMNRSAVNVRADTEPNLLKLRTPTVSPQIIMSSESCDNFVPLSEMITVANNEPNFLQKKEKTNSLAADESQCLQKIKQTNSLVSDGSPCYQKMKQTNCLTFL